MRARASSPIAAAAPRTSNPKLCKSEARATSSPVLGSRSRGQEPLHCGHEHRSTSRRGAQAPRPRTPETRRSQQAIARGSDTPDTFIDSHSGLANAPCATHAGANVARTEERLARIAEPVACTESHCNLVRGACTPSAASCAESNRYWNTKRGVRMCG